MLCYKLTILGQNTYFCDVFNAFGVLLAPLFLIYATILYTFHDSELAVFQPFLNKMFRVFFEMLIFIVFGGLTPIWLDKQAFAPIFQF